MTKQTFKISFLISLKLTLLVVLFFSTSACKEETIDPNSVELSVKNGDTFTIELPVQSSSGSTGISWYLMTTNLDKTLEIVKEEEIVNPTGSTNWGAKKWQFKALKENTINLQFLFIRPSVPTEKYGEKTYKITIN